MNGVLTNKASGIKQTDEISRLNGGVQVVYFFNPSQGFICDLIQSALLKGGIKTKYEVMSATFMHQKLKQDPTHEFSITVHSQGCTRLNNIGNLLQEHERQRISVEAYGPATIIQEGKFKSVDNYISVFDCVPWTSAWNYIKNVAGFDSNATFLTPNSWNPLTEHFLMGETYWQKMRDLGEKFQEKYLQK